MKPVHDTFDQGFELGDNRISTFLGHIKGADIYLNEARSAIYVLMHDDFNKVLAYLPTEWRYGFSIPHPDVLNFVSSYFAIIR